MNDRPRGRSERGSASVLVAGACVIALLLGLAAIVAAAAAQAAAQARSAADLSAVAAARALVDGLGNSDQPKPCATAADIAARNGAMIDGCAIDGQVNVTVRVVVPFTAGVSWLPDRMAAHAAARAGPESVAGGDDERKP